jgi:hypothetical protein
MMPHSQEECHSGKQLRSVGIATGRGRKNPQEKTVRWTKESPQQVYHARRVQISA